MLRPASADLQWFARGADPGRSRSPAEAPGRQRRRAGCGSSLRELPAARGRRCSRCSAGHGRTGRSRSPRRQQRPRSRRGSRLTAAPLHLPAGFRLPPPQEPRAGAPRARPPPALGAASRRWLRPKQRTSQPDALSPRPPRPELPPRSHLTSPSPAHGPARPRLSLRSRGRPRSRPRRELCLPGGRRGGRRPSAAVHTGGQESAGRAQSRGPARTAAAPRLTCSGRAERGGPAPQPPAPPRPRARAFPAVYAADTGRLPGAAAAVTASARLLQIAEPHLGRRRKKHRSKGKKKIKIKF